MDDKGVLGSGDRSIVLGTGVDLEDPKAVQALLNDPRVKALMQPKRVIYDATPSAALSAATVLEKKFLRRVKPDHFDRRAIESVLQNTGAEPSVEMLARLMHFGAVWARDFFPTFDLTHGLTTALLLTQSDAKPLSEVIFPYPAFRIGLPGPDYALTADTNHGQHPIVGILVLRTKSLETPDALRRLSDRMVRETESIEDPDERFAAARRIAEPELAADGTEHVEILLERASHDTDCGYIRVPFSMRGEPERTVGDFLDAIMKSVADEDEGISDEVAQRLLSALHAAARIVVNLSLYLAPTPTGEPQRKPIRRAPVTHAMSDERPMPKVWLVGQDLKLPKVLRDDVSRNIRDGGGRTPWRLRERISVRAHQQHYWIKDPVTGEKVRTLKTKAPYEKGPDSVEACIRHYTTVFHQGAYQGLARSVQE